MSWTRALHFDSWANTQNSQHTFPLLIRRLVRRTVPSSAIVRVPAIEQVQRPGWDGIVEVTEGNQFVPSGKSVWEMGVTRNIKRKADDDFDKRTDGACVDMRQESTFVFVTAREWRKKDEWAEDKKNSSDWKDVIALDANDLEHWIELCPAVDVWFSTISGRRPEGLIDLAARWDGLSRIAAHPLSQQVLLTSRDSCCAGLLRWFGGKPGSLLLKSESIGDGLDFLSAFASANQEDTPDLERMCVVNDFNAWRSLSLNHDPLILVATASLPLPAEDMAEAVASGHHVLIVGSRSASLTTTELSLPRQESYAVTTELKQCGFDDSTARFLALASCGSSSVLKRLLTQHPQTSFPEWSQKGNRTELAPFALLGGWVHVDPEPDTQHPFVFNPPIDLLCIEDFMGITRESLEASVSRWCGSDEPLFLRFGDHILVASREDAWHLLGSAITPQMMSRFEELASLVLEEDNPALDLESKDRWLANLYGKTHSLSGELRQGILESLVLMAVYPTAERSALNVDFKTTVRRILSRVLPSDASWKRWATFNRQLTLFAESDPDFLLSRIEEDLSSPTPQIPLLFENNSTGLLSSSIHCGLLWSLEIIAWNAAYLGRITEILAHLVEIERSLPNNIGNRPSISLRGIFLWWRPHTNASVDEKIAALQQLVDRHPETGWALLIDLFPRTHSYTDTKEMPRWRNWAVGWSREKVHRERYDYALKIASLVMEYAAESPARWSQILDGIFRYCDEVTSDALAQLSGIAASSEDLSGSWVLWQSLRDLISRHQAYPEAEWTFEDELLHQLSVLRDQLKPQDPVVLNGWLFDHRSILPEIDARSDYDAEIDSQRTEVLGQIISAQGWDGVRRLVENSSDASAIGWIVGRHRFLNPEEVGLWELVESEHSQLRKFTSAYVAGSFNVEGFAFLENLQLEAQSPTQAAAVLCSTPFERPIWEWIDSNTNEAIRENYWQRCWGLVRGKKKDDLLFVMDRLLQARRPFTTIHILQMAMQNSGADCELIYRVLEVGLSPDGNQEEASQLDSYATRTLIKTLQEQSTDQVQRLARIEWGYLPVLDPYSSSVRPATLIRELQSSPSLFVELLKLGYRCDNEEPRERPLTEFEQRRSRRARDLLEAFSTVPGAGEDGEIDEGHLWQWTAQVRSLAEQGNFIEDADRQLGRLFSCYPRCENAIWPPLAICRVMESSGSKDMLNSFTVGLYNGCGARILSASTGGDPQHALAADYRAIADEHQTQFPHVAESFRNLAEDYDRYAEREDIAAERRRLER